MLGAFICCGSALVVLQLRHGLEQVSAHNEKLKNEGQAWYGMEKFFKDTQSCSGFFHGRRLGDTVVGEGFGPVIGKEWLNTGLIVKDLYLLRREDEVAWNVKKGAWDPLSGEGEIYVKVTLVARPENGEMLGVDYLLNAPAVSRIFSMKVSMSEERTFTDCDAQKVQAACQQAAFESGSLPLIRRARAPAATDLKCDDATAHRTTCVLPGERFPINKCL